MSEKTKRNETNNSERVKSQKLQKEEDKKERIPKRESAEDILQPLSKKYKCTVFKHSFEELLAQTIPENCLLYFHLILNYTILNIFGKPRNQSETLEVLYTYINHVIPFDSITRRNHQRKAKDIKAPPYVLKVVLIEAKNLKATDSDGTSDPYCKLWINSKTNQEKMSEIQTNTTNPTWNELFYFGIGGMGSDVLHVEIWDSDPRGIAANLAQIKRIRSGRGCMYFCYEFWENICICGRRASDDFIGSFEIKINEIYAEGMDEWFPLETETGSEGEIHIAIEFEVSPPKHTFNALKRHLLLWKILVENALKEKEIFKVQKWEDFLSAPAFTIMNQHRVQGHIAAFEDSVCRFIITIYFIRHGSDFSYKFIYDRLYDANECFLQAMADEIFLENSFYTLYHNKVEVLNKKALLLLSRLHSFDLVKDASSRTEFEYILRCVYLSEDIMSLELNPLMSLETEAVDWFKSKVEEMNQQRDENKAEYIIDTLMYIRKFQMEADKILHDVSSGTTYTSLIYKDLDLIFYEPLMFHVSKIAYNSLNVGEKDQTIKKEKAIAIFLELNELVSYIDQIIDVTMPLALRNFPMWFGSDVIQDWFTWKKRIVFDSISAFVSSDNLENITGPSGNIENKSISVQQVLDEILKEVYVFRDLITSPSFKKWGLIFYQTFHDCCLKYSEEILGQIELQNLHQNFYTGGRKKMCMIANNLWTLSMLAQNSIPKNIEASHILPRTSFTLKMACRLLCVDITKELKSTLSQNILQIVTSNNVEEQKKSVTNCVEHFKKLIWKEAAVDMIVEVLLLFTVEIWNQAVEVITYFKNEAKLRKDSIIVQCLVRPPSIFTGLLNALTEMKTLCVLDDEGKLDEFITTETYKKLEYELKELSDDPVK